MSLERENIYYWKCDRSSAFHGTTDYRRDSASLVDPLRRALAHRFGPDAATIGPSPLGQGNHRTFRGTLAGREVFIRVENGPEGDGYFAVEAEVTKRIAACGVPVPETIAYDCSRRETPFAWQVLPYLPYGDLNRFGKSGDLDWSGIAPAVGRAIAAWQKIRPEGFGPFSAARAEEGELTGLHRTYGEYYRLNLENHLRFLEKAAFLSAGDARRIRAVVDRRREALRLERGVLVHKDLALWNILGTRGEVKAFIDWDDCICGDPMDDLSLMGVTGSDRSTRAVLAAYEEAAGFPGNAERRFWLCWLRNIVFKAVIRVGAGYFDMNDDGFFLIGGGSDGAALAEATRRKIDQALEALEKDRGFDALD